MSVESSSDKLASGLDAAALNRREFHEGDRTALAFGALLHDVGKVIYRGISTRGTHSKLGADFLENEVAAQNPEYESELGTKVIEQVRYHHKREMNGCRLPQDSLAYITYFADNISAGADRKNEGDDSTHAYFDRTAKLRKIFNILNGHHDDNVIEHDDYNRIREDLSRNLVGLQIHWNYVDSLLNVLEATTDRVPSSTNTSELIDVSLYDHAKTTAGIALCIYDYLYECNMQDYKRAFFNSENAQHYYAEPMFRLCSLDMSGIQDFIYNISGEGALKQLRARSMYLELLLEDVVDELLDALNLTRTNLLYTGGGHAYMLLPNTRNTESVITRFQDELNRWFIKNYKTDLFIAIASVKCSANDLANEGDGTRYSNLYHELGNRLSVAKTSRYSASIISGLNFGDDSIVDHSRECTECHRSDSNIDSDGKCELCRKLGEISKQLVDKNVFVVSDDPSGLALPFGSYLSMWTRSDYKAKRPELRRVYTKGRDTGLKLVTHIRMGDYTAPTNGKGISYFADHGASLEQDISGRSIGINRLGVLRADVDNLGATFARGLPANKASISRSATLSRSLSYFFKDRLNVVLGEKRYQLQIIYSGGDDLFLVGNWDDIIHAAIDIRNAFADYVGNGSLTISAGIGMFGEKYPIARMADAAGNLVDSAKSFKAYGSAAITKNAVTLWSSYYTFSWDEAYWQGCP